ncbi:MAG: SDR family NAD(P)-dependent oxidoreductase [Prochloraceae cyanobacterium]|nr:SDR family NAD(P)-dependent oxidoreductase [Prochloraceae cyanobacterium]
MKEFENKVALVTGGSSGIGRATAIAFAREGANVVVAARRVKEGSETIRLIREAGSDGIFIKTDVTVEEEVRALIEKTIDTYSRLDCAFNNAGVAMGGSLTETTVDIYEKVFDVNVKGVLLCLKYEIQEMLKNGGGSIVNNSSIAGLTGIEQISVYVASKHAVLGLTKAAALEMAKSNNQPICGKQ